VKICASDNFFAVSVATRKIECPRWVAEIASGCART
jgi:hypothetical protein